jgi:hypothetical protein
MPYHEEEELEAAKSQEMSEATEKAESAGLPEEDLEKVAGGFSMTQVTQVGDSISNLISQVNSMVNPTTSLTAH